MCDQIELVPMPAWVQRNGIDFATSHEFGLNAEGVECFRIDACIAPALVAVWAAGFKTLGCCCGHDQKRGVISLDMGVGGVAAEHNCLFCGFHHSSELAVRQRSEAGI